MPYRNITANVRTVDNKGVNGTLIFQPVSVPDTPGDGTIVVPNEVSFSISNGLPTTSPMVVADGAYAVYMQEIGKTRQLLKNVTISADANLDTL